MDKETKLENFWIIGTFLFLSALAAISIGINIRYEKKKDAALNEVFAVKKPFNEGDKVSEIALFNDKGEYITQVIDTKHSNKVYTIRLIETYAIWTNGRKEILKVDMPSCMKNVGARLEFDIENDVIYYIYNDYKTKLDVSIKRMYETQAICQVEMKKYLDENYEKIEKYYKKYGDKTEKKILDKYLDKYKRK